MAEDATILFPCGVGRVAFRLLSKLVGIDHTVTGGKSVKGPRSADTLIHMQFRFLPLHLFDQWYCYLQH